MSIQVEPDASKRATYNLYPEAANILGVGRSAAYEGARKGDIPTIRIGRRLLVPRQALERLLQSAELAKPEIYSRLKESPKCE